MVMCMVSAATTPLHNENNRQTFWLQVDSYLLSSASLNVMLGVWGDVRHVAAFLFLFGGKRREEAQIIGMMRWREEMAGSGGKYDRDHDLVPCSHAQHTAACIP